MSGVRPESQNIAKFVQTVHASRGKKGAYRKKVAESCDKMSPKVSVTFCSKHSFTTFSLKKENDPLSTPCPRPRPAAVSRCAALRRPSRLLRFEAMGLGIRGWTGGSSIHMDPAGFFVDKKHLAKNNVRMPFLKKDPRGFD